MLTSMLPHLPNQQMYGGQGTFMLHVLAEDLEGHQRWLGRNFVTSPTETDQVPTTLTIGNDNIAKPFGAIDTPAQGQTVSGALWDFGWTLTPDGDTSAGPGDVFMPLSGSTQWMYIDGAPVGPVTLFDLCRGTVGSPVPAGLYCDDDVASIFGNPSPQPLYTPRKDNPTRYRNLDMGRGSMAAYYLDTTKLSNGLHTIVWGVTDSANRSEGIGSRYFTVLNASSDASAASRAPATMPLLTQLPDPPAQRRGKAVDLEDRPVASYGVRGRTGFDRSGSPAETAGDDVGVRRVQLAPLGRLELDLGPVDAGYLVG